MAAVSPNEGRFESINTWDNSFLSFGIYQWTLGANNSAGELPALLALLQEKFPETFDGHFGQFGMGTRLSATPAHGVRRGYVTLNGTPCIDRSNKEQFRALEWSYRFYHAGKDPKVQLAQFDHAIGRIDCFYHGAKQIYKELTLPEIFNSEYAVALLLDHHINRPGHLVKVVKMALQGLEDSLDLNNPTSWSDSDEQILIQEYLTIRAGTSMTDSIHRAERVTKALEEGKISSQRGSYQKS